MARATIVTYILLIADELMGRTTEPKLPTNIPLLDLPNTFSDFMHEKIANIRRVLDSCPVPASFEPFAGTGLCTFAPVSEDVIRKLINDAPPKCCALDHIPTALLKTCYENLVPVITKIVNYSLLSGSVPQCFKQALVRPLLKKPSLDQNTLKNYRPVVKELQTSVQSFVSVKASGKSCALTVN